MLFFTIEAICKCGKHITMVAQGPYYDYAGEYRLRDETLADGHTLKQYDALLCNECQEKEIRKGGKGFFE